MPNLYAHYSLGLRALPRMSAPQAEIVKEHANAFILGLQGPDVFFYGSIFHDGLASDFGSKLHIYSGRQVFEKMLSPYKNKPIPSDVKAYMMGFLGHYSLDVTAHPYVFDVQGDIAHHRALETDFDSYLLRLEGNQAPWKSRLYQYLPADKKTQRTLVKAYTPWGEIPKKRIITSIRDFRLIRRLMRTPGLLKFYFVQGVMKKVGKYDAFFGMLMPPASKSFPNGDVWQDKPIGSMEKLKVLHDEALVVYLENLNELDERIHDQVPFSDFFDHNFEGERVARL